MAPIERNEIKAAVATAVRYWPNGHLGEYSASEDRASAFRFLRTRLDRGETPLQAASDLYVNALRYRDC